MDEVDPPVVVLRMQLLDWAGERHRIGRHYQPEVKVRMKVQAISAVEAVGLAAPSSKLSTRSEYAEEGRSCCTKELSGPVEALPLTMKVCWAVRVEVQLAVRSEVPSRVVQVRMLMAAQAHMTMAEQARMLMAEQALADEMADPQLAEEEHMV
jgi:hypothetical protein